MKISVIIPVYNAEKYVANAVESALQFPEVAEVVLVEDESPDDALKVCEKLATKHDRVKLYQHPDRKNHGAGESRNLGIAKATGDFIAFLDADDVYLPNRFEAEKKTFQNPDAEGVYNAVGISYYTEKARDQYYGTYGEKLDTVYKIHAPEEVCPGQLHLRGSFGMIHLDGLTVRKSALEKMPKLFNPELRLHQDTDFTVRLGFYLKLFTGNYREAVALRGIHENNRITVVDSKKTNPATTRVKLWKSLQNWAEIEPKMPEEFRKHITRMHRSFEIANAPFPKKWAMILGGIFTDFRGIRSGLYNINFRRDLF